MTMFMFDLELPSLSTERAEAAAQAAADRNAWPLQLIPGRVEKRWFGIEKAYPTVVELPTESGGPALALEAERDADALVMREDAANRIATTIEILGDHFPEGFTFRATYAGSPVRHDETLAASDLATLTRASRLNEFTRYTVPPLIDQTPN